MQAALERRGVYAEFNDGNYLMFYLSPATRAGELKKLVRLVRTLPRGEVRGERPVAGMVGSKTVMVPLDEAVGRVCARACGVVPPCIPLIAEGCVVTAEAAARLKAAGHTFGLVDGRMEVFEGEE